MIGKLRSNANYSKIFDYNLLSKQMRPGVCKHLFPMDCSWSLLIIPSFIMPHTSFINSKKELVNTKL